MPMSSTIAVFPDKVMPWHQDLSTKPQACLITGLGLLLFMAYWTEAQASKVFKKHRALLSTPVWAVLGTTALGYGQSQLHRLSNALPACCRAIVSEVSSFSPPELFLPLSADTAGQTRECVLLVTSRELFMKNPSIPTRRLSITQSSGTELCCRLWRSLRMLLSARIKGAQVTEHPIQIDP